MHMESTLLYLILIIVAARGGGELAERFHQPAVFGEILAGVLLGLIPEVRAALGNDAILFLSEIGVILLLFEVGLDSEFDEFLKVGIPAAMVALIGVIMPLVVGFTVTRLLGLTINQSLFIGATLTATSVGITARVLKDLRQSQSKEAKIIIGAAVVDDILGLLVLSVVLGIAAPAAAAHMTNPFVTIALAVVFLVASLYIGLKAAPFLVGLTRKMRSRGILTVAAFAFCLVLSYISSRVGLSPIVGAFAAGLVLASTEDRVRITDRIIPVADVFVPVFFAVVGMHVDLRFLSWPILGLAAVLLVIAVVTKLMAGLGALRQRVNKLTIGIGMVPRGEVGLIFASIGLSSRILSPALYGAIIITVLLTTLVSPPWLKLQLQRVQSKQPPRGRRVRNQDGGSISDR